MTSYRVRAEFTIEITDEEAAKATAREKIRTEIANSEAAGQPVEISDGSSPETASFRWAEEQEDGVVTISAAAVIAHGASAVPFANVSDLTVSRIDG